MFKWKSMKVGLMVPCNVDMFYPEVGIATVELLEKLKIDFEYPYEQICCGQPMANSVMGKRRQLRIFSFSVIVICGALVWAAVTSFITTEASKSAETVIAFRIFNSTFRDLSQRRFLSSASAVSPLQSLGCLTEDS
jgi:hypothetical protein